jgi:hypothetical protein
MLLPLIKGRLAEYVTKGEFGLASGAEPDGKYRRVWFREEVSGVEIAFEADVYLLTKGLAQRLKSPEVTPTSPPKPEAPPLPELARISHNASRT